MSALKHVRIAALKRKYRQLHAELSARSSAFSCGAALADFISPDLSRLEAEMKAIITELERIDPHFPKRAA